MVALPWMWIKELWLSWVQIIKCHQENEDHLFDRRPVELEWAISLWIMVLRSSMWWFFLLLELSAKWSCRLKI